MTPLWTAEQLDLEGRKLGRASDWARNAKAGAFVSDPYELLVLDGNLRIYSMVTSLLVAFLLSHHVTGQLLSMMEIPTVTRSTFEPLAYTIVMANVGACVVNANIAPSQNRNRWVWAIKGLFGGPLSISQLRSLDTLITRAEQEQRK
jgi:hypothetical protein